ncbi:MAG: hypothetical protein ACKOSO_06645 [Actinomycetota bacterium]
MPAGTAWTDQAPITTDFDDPLWERELHYLRLFRAWGEAHGVPVVFALVPRRVDPLVDPSVPRRFQELVGAPLLVAPLAVREAAYVDGYSDSAHLNKRGRAAYTAWLATAIKPQVNPAP